MKSSTDELAVFDSQKGKICIMSSKREVKLKTLGEF